MTAALNMQTNWGYRLVTCWKCWTASFCTVHCRCWEHISSFKSHTQTTDDRKAPGLFCFPPCGSLHYSNSKKCFKTVHITWSSKSPLTAELGVVKADTIQQSQHFAALQPTQLHFVVQYISNYVIVWTQHNFVRSVTSSALFTHYVFV